MVLLYIPPAKGRYFKEIMLYLLKQECKDKTFQDVLKLCMDIGQVEVVDGSPIKGCCQELSGDKCDFMHIYGT
jgi:hypothetical protein